LIRLPEIEGHLDTSAFRQLRRQGTLISANDLWPAVIVLQHNLMLHARDRHLDHQPQNARG
jgi:predicted nucleic acid-binding protein